MVAEKQMSDDPHLCVHAEWDERDEHVCVSATGRLLCCPPTAGSGAVCSILPFRKLSVSHV